MRPVARSRSVSVAAMLVAAITLGACEGYVKRGSALYADGRYIEAAEVFERTEYRLRDSSPKERAEYAVYRGMTLLVLGDVRSAERWLAYAYEVERHTPGSLRADRRALLDRGWFELGQRLRSDPLAGQDPPGTAIAASQPPPPVAPPPSDSPGAAPKQERSFVPQ